MCIYQVLQRGDMHSRCSYALGRTGAITRHGRLALVGRLLLVVAVEAVLVDVVDHLVGNVVADALASLAEEANLGRRHVVLDELRNNADVVPPLLQLHEGVIWYKSVIQGIAGSEEHTDISAAAFEDKGAVVAQDPAQILTSPQSRCAHGLDQVGAG